MAPLIDIVFLLLIFFVFTAGMVNEPLGVEIHLPGSTTANAQGTLPLVVFVASDGRLFVDEDMVRPGELADAIRQRTAKSARQLAIYADQGVDFQTVLAVMDAARQAGIRDIDFAVQPAARRR